LRTLPIFGAFLFAFSLNTGRNILAIHVGKTGLPNDWVLAIFIANAIDDRSVALGPRVAGATESKNQKEDRNNEVLFTHENIVLGQRLQRELTGSRGYLVTNARRPGSEPV